MNSLTLNAIALSIFGMTLSILLGPYLNLSPALTAGTIFLVLCALTVDTFRFQSLGITLFLDALAQCWRPYRQRVIHHEAGHFLVAYLLDLPIESYTLSVWEAMQQSGAQYGGVVLVQSVNELNPVWIKANIEKLCTVWAAGGIAEDLQYGSIHGNEDDLRQLRQTLKLLELDISLYEQRAKRRARQLIKDHWLSYQALISHLEARRTIPECCKVIEQFKPLAVS